MNFPDALRIIRRIFFGRPGPLERIRYALTNDVRCFGTYVGEMQAHQSQRSRGDTLVILGDSILRALDARQIFNGPAVNFSIGGDTAGGMAMRVATYDIQYTRRLVLLVGCNDLARYSDGRILADYQALLNILRPRSVLVCAVLPLHEATFRPAFITRLNGRRVNNARIAAFNGQLENLCRAHANVRFGDPTDLLVDASGNLRAEFTRDGIHPNAAGYLVLQQYLKAQLAAMAAAAPALPNQVITSVPLSFSR